MLLVPHPFEMPSTLRATFTLAVALPLAGCVESTAPSDVTPPAVTLDTPAPGTLGLTGAIALGATATDSAGVALVQFLVDGISLGQDVAAPYEQVLPATSAYTTGQHAIGVAALDLNGNWSDTTWSAVTFGGTDSLPDGFTRVPHVTGLGAQPTAIAAAADGRLFVTEKTGAIRVIKDGALLPTPFASVTVSIGSERGLIGIALSPGFALTGHVYVYYTTAEGGIHNRISRFVALGDVAAAAEEPLVDLPLLSTAQNHNGGAMAFGLDGLLYVAVGDNANSSLAPLTTSPFGKMLRFNPDGSIPTSNPFYAGNSGVSRAIWARGLRNPYTFSFDTLNGRMYLNDVGEVTWEEINIGRAGANYGWPATEGPTTAAGVDGPLFAYRHTGSPPLFNGIAIVGSAFYRPSSPATTNFGTEYVGDYFFADYGSGWVYRLSSLAGGAPVAFALMGGSPTNLAFGADGALYVTTGTRVDRIAR